MFLYLTVILVCSVYHTLTMSQNSVVPCSSEFIWEAIFYYLLSSKHMLGLVIFYQLIVVLKMFRNQISAGTADAGEWLAHSLQWSSGLLSRSARGFKAIVLCDVLIRAQLGMSRIHYTDHRVSILLWKLTMDHGFLTSWWKGANRANGRLKKVWLKDGEAFIFCLWKEVTQGPQRTSKNNCKC